MSDMNTKMLNIGVAAVCVRPWPDKSNSRTGLVFLHHYALDMMTLTSYLPSERLLCERKLYPVSPSPVLRSVTRFPSFSRSIMLNTGTPPQLITSRASQSLHRGHHGPLPHSEHCAISRKAMSLCLAHPWLRVPRHRPPRQVWPRCRPARSCTERRILLAKSLVCRELSLSKEHGWAWRYCRYPNPVSTCR
jgi:hypothetical protein